MRRKTLKKCLTDFIRDRKKLAVYLAAVSALVFGLLLPGRIVVAISPSLDHRVFVVTKSFTPDEIRKDDYIMFTVRSHYIKERKAIETLEEGIVRHGREARNEEPRVLLRRRVPGNGEVVFPKRGACRCVRLFRDRARGEALRHGPSCGQLRFEVSRLHRKEQS